MWIDIVFVAICVLGFILGMQRGFISQFVAIVGKLAGVAVAMIMSKSVTAYVMKTFLNDTINANVGTVTKALNDNVKLPVQISDNLVLTSTKPAVYAITFIIVFILIALIVGFLVGKLLGVLNVVSKLKVIGMLNSVLGGVLNTALKALIMGVLCYLLTYTIGTGVITNNVVTEQVANSIMCTKVVALVI